MTNDKTVFDPGATKPGGSETVDKDTITVMEDLADLSTGKTAVTEDVTAPREDVTTTSKTKAEPMTDEEKAKQIEQIIEDLLAKRASTPPERKTKDGKYKLGKMLGADGTFYFYEAEEADTGKAVRLMIPRPYRTDDLRTDANIQAVMRTESRASRCAFDSNMAASDHTPVLCWHSPEDDAKESRISYLVSYQPWGMDFYEWEKRRPSTSEAEAVSLTIELLSALEGLHSGRCSYYMGFGEYMCRTGKPMVHRLVHPGNIRIVQSEGEDMPHLLLTGFCRATLSGRNDHATDYFDMPVPCKPHFACREHLIPRRPSEAWDVWGAAACLYYFLTGKTPRRVENKANLYHELFHAPAIPINEQGRLIRTPHLAEIIDSALNEENGLKYENAQALMAALSACIAPDLSD